MAIHPVVLFLHRMTTCAKCGKSVIEDRIVLVRINPLGIKGIFHCEACLTPEQQAARDPETKRLTDIIRQDQYDKDNRE